LGKSHSQWELTLKTKLPNSLLPLWYNTDAVAEPRNVPISYKKSQLLIYTLKLIKKYT